MKIIYQILIDKILIPLLKKGVGFVINWFKERKRKKQLIKEVKEKVKKYEESKTVDSSVDNFNKLP